MEKSAQRFGLRKAPNDSSLTCSSQSRPPLERLTPLSEYVSELGAWISTLILFVAKRWLEASITKVGRT